MLKHRERDRDPDSRRPHSPDERRARHPEERRPGGTSGNGSSKAVAPSRMSGAQAVEQAKAHLTDLTGGVAEGLSSLTRTRDGWRVVLETVELERIPRTTDIMASYAIDLDGRGDLMGYQRIARYYRSDVSGEQ